VVVLASVVLIILKRQILEKSDTPSPATFEDYWPACLAWFSHAPACPFFPREAAFSEVNFLARKVRDRFV